MGLLFELIDILAAVGASLAIGSGIRDYIRKRSSPSAPAGERQASVLIKMPNGKSVHLDMPTEEAERLAHR